MNGSRLYRTHCAPCHGISGRGDGPASDYLYPRPANHTDSTYMASRDDRSLFTAIRKGGPGVDRSSLMPRFDDRFRDSEVYDLIAYIRSLHRDAASIFGEGVAAMRHSTVLEPVGPRVDFLTDARGRAAVVSDERAIVLSPDGIVERVDPPVDAAIVEPLVDQLRRALLQEQRDVDDAKRIYTMYRTSPDSLAPVQRRFVKSCAACHGMTGRVVGPGVQSTTFVAANLADGTRMNARPDEFVRNVVALGGTWARISDVMPGYEHTVSGAELDELVTYVRSLAIPPHPASNRLDRGCSRR
ncbi:MAG: c-type cytochrome [Planctomycetes bacterium]|nr:c-type cytochrome [Planctomycetota bacterium]MBI3845394.1 c-type cytochrome [Planctomycetota bacterium]